MRAVRRCGGVKVGRTRCHTGVSLCCLRPGVPGECAAARADRAPDALPPAAVPPGHAEDRERGGEGTSGMPCSRYLCRLCAERAREKGLTCQQSCRASRVHSEASSLPCLCNHGDITPPCLFSLSTVYDCSNTMQYSP